MASINVSNVLDELFEWAHQHKELEERLIEFAAANVHQVFARLGCQDVEEFKKRLAVYKSHAQFSRIVEAIVSRVLIPEIWLHIAEWLDTKHLRECTLVSKAWNTTFTPLLWRNFGLRNHQSATAPSLAAVHQHALSVRSLKAANLPRELLDVDYQHLQHITIGPNRRQSHREYDWNPIYGLLRRSASTLRSVAVLTMGNSLPSALWDTLQNCPMLDKLVFNPCVVDMATATAFWDVCSRVKTIQLSRILLVQLKNTTSENITLATNPFAFDITLRKIREASALKHLVPLSFSCPNLRRMELSCDKPYLPRPTLIPREIAFLPRPYLSLIYLNNVTVSDVSMAALLDSIPLMTLTELYLLKTGLGPRGLTSIHRHAQSIQHLHIQDSPAWTSKHFVKILTSFPRLLTVKAPYIWARDVAACPDPWVCTDLILVYSLSILFLCTVANALFTPLITTGASSSFVENKAMYISGGFNRPQRVVPQTFAIDLSSDWDASAPKAIELSTVNSLQDAVVPNAALSSTDGRLVVFSNGYTSIYTPSTNQWSNPLVVHYYNPNDAFHLAAAADPRTGLIYVPSGYETGTGNATVTTMLQYDPVVGTSTSLSMNGGPGFVKGYSIIWSDYLNKFVICGGYTVAEPFNILSIYDPDTRTWTQPTASNSPPARVRHCAVPWMGGQKMVVFGGFVDSAWTVALDDIWELDLSTYVWSKGTNATGLGRGLMVCAISNNSFVSWGGQDKTGIVSSNSTLVYDLSSNAWVSSYVSGAVPPSPQKSNTGVIVGVVVGVIVLLAVAVALWFWLKKRKSHRKQRVLSSDGHPSPDSEVGSTQELSQSIPEMSEKPLWAPVPVNAEGTAVHSPTNAYTLGVHPHNPQLRYPDNLDYFPPPAPTASSARTPFSTAGCDDSVKVEFTQPPLLRSPQEILPYVQPLDGDESDPRGIVVPNHYRE
ncbi:hypothetical protein BGZ52_004019 [Haplosporangium bisporale]|nr:hypothetical protein BGZ52_004019 [Haplosporangium bisporale]